MIYTDKEQMVKNRTVKDAVDAASFICRDRYKVKAKVDKFSHRLDEKITIIELNKISDEIIADSI